MSYNIEFLNLGRNNAFRIRFVSKAITFRRHWYYEGERPYPIRNCPDDCPLCETDKPQQRWAAIIEHANKFKIFEFGIVLENQFASYYGDRLVLKKGFTLGDPNNDFDWYVESIDNGRFPQYVASPSDIRSDVLSVEQREGAGFYYEKMVAAFLPLTRIDVLNIMKGIVPDYKKNMIRKLKKKYPKNRWTTLEII